VDTRDLARAAIEGSRQAFERLVAMHREGIYRMAYARLRNVSDAEDVVQDVFLRAYRTVGSLREPSMFRAWLYRIALNRVRDVGRRRKILGVFGFGAREEPETHAATGPDGFDMLAAKRFWERLDGFLETLSPIQREVFRLRFVDGLAIHEICGILGKNESTVKTHLYRAVERFREVAGLFERTAGEASR